MDKGTENRYYWFMSNEDLKKLVKKWADSVGHKKAMRVLVNTDVVSVAIAQKLFRGNYQSELSFDKAQAIIRAMAKDGFSFTDGKAS